MAIDDTVYGQAGDGASSPSGDPTQHGPTYIQTWPLTTEDLAGAGHAAVATADAPADEEVEPVREPELVIPEAVKYWPAWMQRQWTETQRRRLWETRHPPTFASRIFTPASMFMLSALLIVALLSFGIGAMVRGGAAPSTSSQTTSSSGSGMAGMAGMGGSSSSSSASTASVPDATQQYGNQPAKFVMDPGGVKHFTLTAQQVMWQPVKGQKVLAWTLDGTVPGPVIQATAGDHVRITIVNHLPEATAIHWHGLEVPTDNDGVPPIGMKPVDPGHSYTYDFTLQDQDAGTHWYHSHYDDLKQVGGGMYGAFIVNPRPGTPEYQQMKPLMSAQVNQIMFVGMLGSYYVINGKSFPDTQPIVVQHGQTVHISLIGADTQMIHPMHLHGHTFQIVAEDGHMLAAPISKDTVQLAPGETYDLTFYAWATPGSVYPFHCHILSHLMNPGQSNGEMGGLITLIEYQK
jgi:FtsP/CotA-like multicopper oxidase with cupredoxin domain